MTAIDDDCDCEFDPYEDEPFEESWHYKRTCPMCGNVWWALHCPHDRAQNPCPGCGWIAEGKRTPIQLLFHQGPSTRAEAPGE